MAIGFTPKYAEELYLEQFTPHQFLALAVETARKLDWHFNFLSETGFIAHTNKGSFTWNALITLTIEGDKANIKSESTGSEMIDFGRNKKVIMSFTDIFAELKYSQKAEELDQYFETLQPEMVTIEEDILAQPPPSATLKLKSAFSIFIPTKGFFITPLLIDLNILVFILMVISGVSFIEPNAESLLKWGANFRSHTLGGQPWRLLTNCFLHIGVFHLLMNMYALLYIGLLLEPLVGKGRFLAAYLLTGLCASLTSLWWHDLTISAGASGAIFGMYGLFLALLTTKLIEKETRKALLTSIAIFVGYNLIYGMKGGIDNAAHLGGLVSGLVIGYSFIPLLNKPEGKKYNTLIIGTLTIVVLAITTIAYKTISNDLVTYDKRMKEFAANEAMALSVHQLPGDTPNDKILACLQEKVIPSWKKNITIMNEVDKLDLPELIHQKNQKMKEYCWLRLKAYNLFYKGLAENTQRYDGQIEVYNNQIMAIVKELNGEKKE